MKHFKSILLSLTFFILLYNCSDANKNNEMENLQKQMNRFYTAIENGDTPARLKLFTDDATILPNGGKVTRLDSTTRSNWIEYDKEWVFRLKDIEHVEIKIIKDMAYTINTYHYTFHKKDSEPEWHRTKNVHIWKKDTNGLWKLHVDIWNSNF